MSRFNLPATLLLCLTFSIVLTNPASADLAVNGNFETGDTTGWTSFPSSNSSFAAINSPPADVYSGSFSGRLENLAEGSAALVKQANLGVGVVQTNQEIKISFWAKGSATAGGVQFAEFFSEIAGGGTSSSVILGGGPLFLTNTYTFYEFTTLTGPDVSGGVTLQLNAATGANPGSTSTMFFDNVSILAIPEPGSAALLGLGAWGLLIRRRRR